MANKDVYNTIFKRKETTQYELRPKLLNTDRRKQFCEHSVRE